MLYLVHRIYSRRIVKSLAESHVHVLSCGKQPPQIMKTVVLAEIYLEIITNLYIGKFSSLQRIIFKFKHFRKIPILLSITAKKKLYH